MFYEITSTITSKVPITDDGLGRPEHSIDVDGGEMAAVSTDAAMTVVLAGLIASQNALRDQFPRVAKADDRTSPLAKRLEEFLEGKDDLGHMVLVSDLRAVIKGD